MTEKRATDHLEPAAKKRGNDRQLTKDDASDDEGEQVDAGSFARASEDVIKQRKIVRTRRGGDAGGTSTGANPFAGIQLAGAGGTGASANPFSGVSLFPAKPAEHPVPAAGGQGDQRQSELSAAADADKEQEAKLEEAKGSEAKAEGNTKESKDDAGAKPTDVVADAIAPAVEATKGGFGSLAGASGGLAFGTSGGFASTSGGFGSLASSTGGAFSFGAGASSSGTSIFSFSSTAATAPTFSFGLAGPSSSSAAATSSGGGAGTSLFGTTPATGTSVFGAVPAPAAATVLPAEQAVTTGEEDEKTVWSGEGALFEFDAGKQWRERGRGEARLNVAKDGQARLVMRAKGNLRLLLNARLWAEMQVTRMEGGKGATFAVVNHAAAPDEPGAPEGKEGGAEGEEAGAAAEPKLATYALRIKSPEVLENFISAVNNHKVGGGPEGNK